MRHPQSVANPLDQQGFALVPPPLRTTEVEALVDALEVHPAPGVRGIYARRDVLNIALVRQLCEGGLGEIARQVLGGGARPVRGLLFDKIPGANWKVPWHQDITIAARERHECEGFGPWSEKDGVPHVQPPAQVLEGMLTLRLHLDACPRDNGALRVLPGSHLSGKLSAEEIRDWHEHSPEVVCEVEHGGLLLMKPLLLHASSASERPSRRRVLHIEWANQELPPPLEWFYE